MILTIILIVDITMILKYICYKIINEKHDLHYKII